MWSALALAGTLISYDTLSGGWAGREDATWILGQIPDGAFLAQGSQVRGAHESGGGLSLCATKTLATNTLRISNDFTSEGACHASDPSNAVPVSDLWRPIQTRAGRDKGSCIRSANNLPEMWWRVTW